MKISTESIKSLIKLMGYLPEDGVDNIFYKKYSQHNDYIIRINFNSSKIEYREKDIQSENGIQWGDLTTSNFENSENFVVLECVDRLLEKGYSPKNLYLEYKFPLGRNEKGKLDILVFDNDGKAYLMIECKTWGTEFSKEENKMLKDGGQLFSYYVQDKATKYLCLYTSRQNNKFIEYKNNIIKVDEAWTELTNQKEIHDHWNKNIKDNGVFEEWSNAYDVEIKALVRSRLLPLTKDDSGRIFNQFAEILRHNVVSDKPNAFNKILNLFICKIIDEDKNDNEQVEFQWLEDDTDESLQIRLNDLYKQGMHRFLDIDVTDFSDNDIDSTLVNIGDSNAQKAIRDMFVKLRLQKNPEFAFIEVYDDTSFKLNARVVREVVELLQPYQFRYGHKQQFLGDFFELLLNTSIKQEAGQYFTPVPITRYIVSSLPIKEMIEKKLKANEAEMLPSVIDFACGTGHFLTEYMDRVQSIIENEIDISKAKPIARKKLKGWIDYDKFGWAGDYVYGIDADYRLVKSSKVSSFLNGDGEANIIRANGLDHFEKSKEYKGKLKHTCADNNKDNAQFDVLIANPPYAVNAFKSTVKYGEESFELFDKFTDKSSEIECLFIERMKQLLKIGGYAGIILPSTILSNVGVCTSAREILLQYFYIVAVTEFGSNTFMATNTNTVTLFLKRRPNTDCKLARNAVDAFFEKPKDITVLGIEKAFSKYVSAVFEGIKLDDYISFVNRDPNDVFVEQDRYKDYCNWFEKQNDVKKLKVSKAFNEKSKSEQNAELNKLFYDKVLNVEKEKIIFFILSYGQKVVVTSVGEKQSEKDFLGYEFSNSRGREGIKMLPSGTKLYDDDYQYNKEKANFYVYNAFNGDYPTIDSSLNTSISISDLYSMLDLSSATFEKTLNLHATKKVVIESIYEAIPLDEIAEFQDGLWKGEKGELVNAKVIRNTNFKLNNGKLSYDDVAEIEVELSSFLSRKLKRNDIIVEKSGGSPTQPVGRVVLFDKNEDGYSFSNFCSRIRVYNENVNPQYLWLILNEFYKLGGTIPLQNGVRLLNLKMSDYKRIKIPCPSLTIQNKIVDEIAKIEIMNSDYSNKISLLNQQIQDLISDIELQSSYSEKLRRVASINPPKINKDAFESDVKVSFIEMASVNENGYVQEMVNRNFSEVVNKGYTCFKDNDIIIAKITPCMENGKCALVSNLTNGIGYGSTEFHVIRAESEKILPKFLFLLLNRSRIRDSAKLQMTGVAGHKRVPESFYSDLNIAYVDIEMQKDFVSQIENLESEIQKLKDKIAKVEEQKKAVLNKYLK